MTEKERCWRCSAAMEWRHGTWQCPGCQFKLGCCEGEPQSLDEARSCETPPVEPPRVEARS
jgi:hypothetical protein